jgi:hypothetical protein
MKVRNPELLTPAELAYDSQLCEVVKKLSANAIATLHQLVAQGPVWDGNLISKAGRDELVKLGAASKIIYFKKDGYQACTYMGAHMFRKLMFDPATGLEQDTLKEALARWDQINNPGDSEESITITV